eukprot:3443710-Karenia_brevis.AAC.1
MASTWNGMMSDISTLGQMCSIGTKLQNMDGVQIGPPSGQQPVVVQGASQSGQNGNGSSSGDG